MVRLGSDAIGIRGKQLPRAVSLTIQVSSTERRKRRPPSLLWADNVDVVCVLILCRCGTALLGSAPPAHPGPGGRRPV